MSMNWCAVYSTYQKPFEVHTTQNGADFAKTVCLFSLYLDKLYSVCVCLRAGAVGSALQLVWFHLGQLPKLSKKACN